MAAARIAAGGWPGAAGCCHGAIGAGAFLNGVAVQRRPILAHRPSVDARASAITSHFDRAVAGSRSHAHAGARRNERAGADGAAVQRQLGTGVCRADVGARRASTRTRAIAASRLVRGASAGRRNATVSATGISAGGRPGAACGLHGPVGARAVFDRVAGLRRPLLTHAAAVAGRLDRAVARPCPGRRACARHRRRATADDTPVVGCACRAVTLVAGVANTRLTIGTDNAGRVWVAVAVVRIARREGRPAVSNASYGHLAITRARSHR